MKKIIIILIAMLSITCNSQIIMRATNVTYSLDEGETWKNAECNILTSLDMDRDVIEIDNEFRDIFYIRSYEDMVESLDDDGDKYTFWVLDCKDNKNIYCDVTYALWDNINLFSLHIEYSNIIYIYSGEIIDYTESNRTNK